MPYSEQLHPGLLVNRDKSPTSVSSRATSSTCWVWKTACRCNVLPFCSSSVAPVLLSPSFPPENQLSTPGFDFFVLPPLQLSCPSVQSMLTNPPLQVLPFPYSDSTVLCDVSTGSIRPLVPSILRKQLFSAIHRISHPRV